MIERRDDTGDRRIPVPPPLRIDRDNTGLVLIVIGFVILVLAVGSGLVIIFSHCRFLHGRSASDKRWLQVREELSYNLRDLIGGHRRGRYRTGENDGAAAAVNAAAGLFSLHARNV